MTEQEYIDEQAMNKAQDERFAFLSRSFIGELFRDENETMLKAGFDIVTECNSDGTASALLMACCISGDAEKWVRDYTADKAPFSAILITADGTASNPIGVTYF